MLELQRELSAAIARQVRLRLSPKRLTALAPRHTRNAEAYDLYLRGRHLWNQLTPETNRRAVEFYQQATVTRSGVRARVGWPGRHLLSKPNQQRCASAGGVEAGPGGGRAGGCLGP